MSHQEPDDVECPAVNPAFYGCCAISLAFYTGIIFGVCWLIWRER
jgi:hypothetical protein